MLRALTQLVSVLTAVSVLYPAALHAQAPSGGILVQMNGDVTVTPSDSQDVVVVVRGDAVVSGALVAVVVIDGALRLDNARVRYLVGVNANINVGAGSIVSDDVRLVSTTLTVADGAMVEPAVRTGFDFRHGAVLFGFAIGLGFVLLVLAAGLVAAAVTPDGVRAAGTALSDRIGATVLATGVIWLGLPILAAMLALTIIGLPAGVFIVVFVLPALWFLGYIVTGIRIGDWLLEWRRGTVERVHPYLAAIVGLVVLLAVGWIPFVGTIVTPIAAFLGGGALTFVIWRRLRTEAGVAR